MSIDPTKVLFQSNLEIDRLLLVESKQIGAGVTALYNFTGNPPVFEVQFSNNGNMWYQMGTGSPGDPYSYIEGSTIYIRTNASGTARYYVWSDKVDY